MPGTARTASGTRFGSAPVDPAASGIRPRLTDGCGQRCGHDLPATRRKTAAQRAPHASSGVVTPTESPAKARAPRGKTSEAIDTTLAGARLSASFRQALLPGSP